MKPAIEPVKEHRRGTRLAIGHVVTPAIKASATLAHALQEKRALRAPAITRYTSRKPKPASSRDGRRMRSPSPRWSPFIPRVAHRHGRVLRERAEALPARLELFGRVQHHHFPECQRPVQADPAFPGNGGNPGEQPGITEELELACLQCRSISRGTCV